LVFKYKPLGERVFSGLALLVINRKW